MPEGIMVLKWNERSGVELKAQFPEGIAKKVSKETLLHLVNLHAFDEASGVVGLNSEEVNFISYYSGSLDNYFIMLVLNLLDNAEDYEEILKDTAREILNNIVNKKYKEILPDLFERVLDLHKDL